MLQDDVGQIIKYLRAELAKVRAGRASIELVEGITVEVYNSKMPLNQLATLSSPQPRLIVIQPWDKSIIKNIESALRNALTDVNPIVDSDVIRISFPAPTQERRKELVREVGRISEEARISLRQTRQEWLQTIETQEENKEISEDELFRQKEEIQKTTDECNAKIKEIGATKERDIMEG
jgi:ribosome recycling factor